MMVRTALIENMDMSSFDRTMEVRVATGRECVRTNTTRRLS